MYGRVGAYAHSIQLTMGLAIRVGALLFAWAAFSVAVSSVASAQPAELRERAVARALFEEGLRFADQGQWAEAEERFSRSLSLFDSPAVRFNLAVSLHEVGRNLEASERIRPLLELPDDQQALRVQAQALLREVMAQLGRVQIQVRGERDGFRLTLDAEELSDAMIGIYFPIDPGDHRVAAEHQGEDVAVQAFHVNVSEDTDVELVLPILPSSESSSQEGGGRRRLYREWWLWTLVGTAVALTTVGIVVAR